MKRILILFPVVAIVLLAQPQELAMKARQGKTLMEAGQFEDAAIIYRELVAAIPSDAGLRLNLGMAYHLSGQDDLAIPEFEQALEQRPGIVPALLFLGAARLEVGEAEKAIAPLRELVGAQPAMKDARALLGEALTAAGRIEEAAEQYRRWAELDDRNPRAWYSLGLAHETLSQQALKALREKYPESAEMMALLGAVRVTQKQYGSAFFLYQEVLKLRPDFPGAHSALAEIYRQTGHPDWAAEEEIRERDLPEVNCEAKPLHCRFLEGKLLALVSEAARGESADSLFWASQAHSELARRAFERLMDLQPSIERYEFEARFHRNQGRHVEAVKAWREALKLAPGDPALELELAVSLHQSRDDESALPIFQRLLKQSPDSAELNFMLGDTWLGLQNAERAAPYLRKSVDLDPKLMAARASLGRALLMLNEGAEAIPHLEMVLPTDEEGTLHFQLARAYQMAGRPEDAKKMMARYQEVRRTSAAERERLEQEMTITAP